jgi:transposase
VANQAVVKRDNAGHTLQKAETPDEIIEHRANNCRKCGADLNDVVGTKKTETRQEIEIVMKRRCVEHQTIEKECPYCKAKNAGDFPSHVKAPVQSSVKELITYLSVYQFVPYNRINRTKGSRYVCSSFRYTIIGRYRRQRS